MLADAAIRMKKYEEEDKKKKEEEAKKEEEKKKAKETKDKYLAEKANSTHTNFTSRGSVI
jgi:hypothetical protein